MATETNVAEVRRVLDAAPEMVFGAFADPRLVSRWLKPSREIRLDVLAYDFRNGGGYRFGYHVPGGQIMHVNGTFRAIDPPSHLIFSWNIEPPDEHAGVQSEVHVSITPFEAGCELYIRHIDLSHPSAPERHADGWKGALDNLATLLSEGKQHDAHWTCRAILPCADVRAGLCLAPHAARPILQGPADLPGRYHHPVWCAGRRVYWRRRVITGTA